MCWNSIVKYKERKMESELKMLTNKENQLSLECLCQIFSHEMGQHYQLRIKDVGGAVKWRTAPQKFWKIAHCTAAKIYYTALQKSLLRTISVIFEQIDFCLGFSFFWFLNVIRPVYNNKIYYNLHF